MQVVLGVARALHIVGGALALASFWLPWAVGKGSRLHRGAGWVYVAAMALVAGTGAVVCVARLTDGDPRNDAGAVFLLMVGLLALASATYGVRALGAKTRARGATTTPAPRRAWDLAVALALLAAAAVVGALGVGAGRALFVAFAALSGATAVGQLRFWLRPPTTRMAWWYAHMQGMGTACIGTVTAFVVVNARVLGFSSGALVVWLAPGVLGGAALAAWTRYYRARFERAATRPNSAA